MSVPVRVWIWALVVFVPFPVAAVIIARVRDISGAPLWVLWTALLVLGLGAAGVVFLYLKDRKPSSRPGSGLLRRLEEAFADANAMLRRSKLPGVRSGRVIVVVGPPGATKTTLVEQSEFGVELLVGETSADGLTLPTDVVNIWKAGDAAVIEVGVDVLEDERSWRRLVSCLRPRRWAPTLGRGRLPSRSAVVCLPVTQLLSPDANEEVRSAAALLRDRLTEMAMGLGVELPVYVVFTKADRLPYFAEFAAVLDEDEVRGVFGVTLPLDLGGEVAAYGERQMGRLRKSLDRLYRSLGRARIVLLAREPDPTTRLGAYEFPRELDKSRDLIAQFLVDLCRPSQASVNPRLRGFYLTGARVVEKLIQGKSAPMTRAEESSGPVDATHVFSPEEVMAEQAGAAVEGVTVQQVPEWVFTSRLLRETVGGDVMAEALTGSGLLVHVGRRVLLGAAVAALLLVGIGTTVSFRRNVALQAGAAPSIRAVRALPEAPSGPLQIDQLAALDSLRRVIEPLSRLEVDGAPMSYRWGLYRGSRVREVGLSVYFDRFQRYLLADARTALVDHLDGLGRSDGPSGDRGEGYDALKAYLIMAGQSARSTPEFLAPQLYDHWPGRVDLSPNGEELVRDQFAFYARELTLGDPFDFQPHQPLVDSSRDFIRSFADDTRYYPVLIDEASQQGEAISFAAMYPDAAELVRNDVLVPSAFTADGWDFVQRRLDDPDALFGFEDWVVGGDPPPPEERRALAAELRTRYEAEYVRRWVAFLSASSFRRSGAVATTARQLQTLGGRESPILQVLALVAANTNVDSAVAAVFEPVHLVVPPGEAALVGEGNQAYVDALASIGMALAPMAEPGGSGGAASGAVTQVAAQAEDAVRQVALAFPVEGEAGTIADAVEQLLQQPIVSARSLARGLPSRQANAAGSSFCTDFGALANKYPFATGGPDASLEEFVAMFQPGESTLWGYYERTLQNLLERRGSRFEAIPNTTPSATAELVRFFNDAAVISSAFWEGESGPELVFGLQLSTSQRLTEVQVQVDNQVHTFTQTAPRMASVTWSGEGAREASITGVLDGERVQLVAPQDGQWALFEMFRTATWAPRGGRTFDVVWPLPGSWPPLEGTVSLNTDVPVLSRDFLTGLRCASTIVR